MILIQTYRCLKPSRTRSFDWKGHAFASVNSVLLLKHIFSAIFSKATLPFQKDIL